MCFAEKKAGLEYSRAMTELAEAAAQLRAIIYANKRNVKKPLSAVATASFIC